jgi:protein involved in polysaccharide export with SLBB domain
MTFGLHQPDSGSRVVRKPAPQGGAVVRTPAGPLLLAALCLLFGASGLFAKDTMFTDFPVYQPATNILQASMTTNASPPPNATVPLPNATTPIGQAGTNSAGRVSTNDMDALDDTYRLAIGDHISFRIEEDEDDPKELTVTDSGDLEVPYIGRYPAAGKTCKELAQALKAELEKEYYYRATVITAVDSMTKSRGKVYLVGAVRMPGPQDIPSDEVFTVSKAVLRAGGFTDYADKHSVKVTRKGSAPGAAGETLTVDVGEILEKGKIGSDLTLQAGDLIYIPERLVHF